MYRSLLQLHAPHKVVYLRSYPVSSSCNATLVLMHNQRHNLSPNTQLLATLACHITHQHLATLACHVNPLSIRASRDAQDQKF